MKYHLALRHKVVLVFVVIMALLTIASEAPQQDFCSDSAEWVTGDQGAAESFAKQTYLDEDNAVPLEVE